MPTYRFACEGGHEVEAFLGIFEERPDACPSCSRRLNQVFHGQAPQGVVYGDPKTFGQQAELNEKRMGKERMRLLAEKALAREKFSGALPEKGVRPRSIDPGPHVDTGPFLDMAKVPDPMKYVHTGEK